MLKATGAHINAYKQANSASVMTTGYQSHTALFKVNHEKIVLLLFLYMQSVFNDSQCDTDDDNSIALQVKHSSFNLSLHFYYFTSCRLLSTILSVKQITAFQLLSLIPPL